MRMQKRKFRIGYLARHLAVERFVIRFWEREFDIKPSRSDGGQRFYDEQDLATFTEIKELLYKRGFTIAGAKKQLDCKTKPDTILASHKTTLSLAESQTTSTPVEATLLEQLVTLKKKLIALRKYMK